MAVLFVHLKDLKNKILFCTKKGLQIQKKLIQLKNVQKPIIKFLINK